MTKRIVSVHMDDTLAHVKHLFDTHKFHHLLVVEENKLVGVLSDRDLFKALSPNAGTPSETTKDAASLHKRVHQIMSRDLVTIPPRAGLLKAVKLFNEFRVSCIPVVDDNVKPLGILRVSIKFGVLKVTEIKEIPIKSAER